eukprot:5196304-Pyramimonas_sp.AAC.2
MAAFALSSSLVMPTVATCAVSKKNVAQKMAAPLRAGTYSAVPPSCGKLLEASPFGPTIISTF